MNRIVSNADQGQAPISRHIYGHFAEHLGRCIYDGAWVGEGSPIPNTRGIRSAVVEALRKVAIPNLRWPGGCFADAYHWRDGIGPKDQRPRTVNIHWGNVVEDNSFGIHEFMDQCEQLGCEPDICGNGGSGTPQEMLEWIEYMTFPGDSSLANHRRANGRAEPWKVKFWGIGNENWGCGGFMRPEYYADLYRRFQIYVRNYGDNQITKIASGMGGPFIYGTEVLMRDVFKPGGSNAINALSLHYYVYLRETDFSATQFGEDQWFTTLQKALEIDDYIKEHVAIMDYYDPGQQVGLIVDEWGAWYPPEPGANPAFLYQQNTLRDALVAGLTLHIFHEHADRIMMANLAQTINVLQAMILTEGRADDPDAHLPCVRPVPGPPGRDPSRPQPGMRTLQPGRQVPARHQRLGLAQSLRPGPAHPVQPEPQHGRGPGLRTARYGRFQRQRADPDRAPDDRAQHLRPSGCRSPGRVRRRAAHREWPVDPDAGQVRGGADHPVTFG